MEPLGLELTEPKVWGACHKLFENAARDVPHTQYPFAQDAAEEALALVGCEIEAYTRTRDGRRLLAYGLPRDDTTGGGKDLRVAVYGEDDTLQWHTRIDRSSRGGSSFAAAQRGSFIVDVPPYLVCAGTMWEGSVQTSCIKTETEEVVWDGSLSYWSGIAPQAFDKSLFAADMTGLRKVYPWSGVERRFRRFEESGGRSSYYATDGTRLFYADNREAPFVMTAYSFEMMKPLWTRQLPGKLDPIWSAAYADHAIALLHHSEQIIAFDAATGAALWTLHVGEDTPPVTADERYVYFLVRRPKLPNLLAAIEPRTGELAWWALPPTGTLRMRSRLNSLIVGSVRAVQRAILPDPKP